MCMCVNDCDAPRPRELAAECAALSPRGHGRGPGPGPGPAPGRPGRGRRVRARAGAWALTGMTTGSGPAPGGPWAGRACLGRRLRSRPRRLAWPPPAQPRSQAGGYGELLEGRSRAAPGVGGAPLAGGMEERVSGRAASQARSYGWGGGGRRSRDRWGRGWARPGPCGVPGPGGPGTRPVRDLDFLRVT